MQKFYWTIGVTAVLLGITASRFAMRATIEASEFEPVPSYSAQLSPHSSSLPVPIDEAAVASIVRKNLFHPQRTPDFEEPRTDPAPQPKDNFKPQLLGIVQVGSQACARIRIGGSRGRHGQKAEGIYALEEPVGSSGFVLKEIHANAVVLSNGNEELILKLEE